VSADLPLTGDELAAIKNAHGKFSADENDPCFWDNPDKCTTLRLVAEVERLRTLVDGLDEETRECSFCTVGIAGPDHPLVHFDGQKRRLVTQWEPAE
jgi:hypothetical protein